jgi:hypothetical protein
MTDTMKGVPLGTFAETLRPLPAGVMDDPYARTDLTTLLDRETIDALERRYGTKLTSDGIRKLRRSYLEDVGFETICRIRASSMFAMSSSMEELFEEDPRHAMFDRIRSSMWHWGAARPVWNDYVAAYEGLRSFSVDLPGFEARITWTNTFCDGNQSDHCDTWLDGHFAYLIHYRGVHVMTLGFSLAGDSRLLLQQVQLASPRGNRWLFRIPGNRMEFAIDLFRQAFPSHEILVVDGVDLARRNIAGYARTLRKTEDRVETLRSRRDRDEASEDARVRFNRAVVEQQQLAEQIGRLEDDTPRLAALYGDCGRYRRAGAQVVNSMTHYRLAA